LASHRQRFGDAWSFESFLFSHAVYLNVPERLISTSFVTYVLPVFWSLEIICSVSDFGWDCGSLGTFQYYGELSYSFIFVTLYRLYWVGLP